MATAVGANKGPGGHRDERAVDLVLLGLNYSLEKAKIKKQEAPTAARMAGVCLVRRCFPFFYSLFPLSLFDGTQQTPSLAPPVPHAAGWPQDQGVPSTLVLDGMPVASMGLGSR